MKKLLLKLSILSISLVLTSAAAINSTIPLIQEAHPELALSSIELLSTIPNIMVTICLFVSIFFVSKIGTKKTVLTGLTLSLIGGVTPFFVDNYLLMLISRAILGAGFGLFNSLAISLIYGFYSGEEATKMIGMQVAFQGLGNACMTLLAGVLLKINYQYAFLIYFIIIPIIILFMINVPDIKLTQEKQTIQLKSLQIPGLIIMLIVMMTCSATNVKLATLIVHKGIGSATASSVISSIVQIASMLAGMYFGYVFTKIKNKVFCLAMICLSLQGIITCFSTNIILIGIASLLGGIGSALFCPYMFNRYPSYIMTTGLLVVANIGGFISPYYSLVLSSIHLVSDSASQVFLSSAIVYFIVLAIYLTIMKKETN